MNLKKKVKKNIEVAQCPYIAKVAGTFFCTAYYDYSNWFTKVTPEERKILCTKSSYRLCLRYKRSRTKKEVADVGTQAQIVKIKYVDSKQSIHARKGGM